MTIQQQLAALGPRFTVDGVEWKVDQNSPNLTYPILLAETIFFSVKIQVWTANWSDWVIEIKGLGCEEDIYYKTDNHEAACRAALALCRERVAELAGALGMVKSDGEIYLKAVEQNSIVPERDFDDSKMSYMDYVAYKTSMVISFQQGANWALGKSFNQPTAQPPKYPCIDPMFEITGCDKPKGSCAACGGGSPLLTQPTGEKEGQA